VQLVTWSAARTRRLAGIAAAALVLAGLYVLRWSGINSGGWVDLAVYVRGAQAFVNGTPLYQSFPGTLPFTYTPFAAVVFAPLSLPGTDTARWLFTAGSLVSYLAVLVVCARQLRLSWQHLALVGVAGMALEPLVRTILLGQINLYLMALVVLDCLLVRSTRRGWLVGLAAGIKIVPGVFILYFVLRRDWRSAVRAAAGFVLTVALGAFVLPAGSRQYWTGGLFEISHWGPVAVVDAKNQSLIGELARISHQPSPTMLTTLVLPAAGLALALAAARRQLRIGDEVAAVTAIAIGGLLASPLSWTHHWVWAVPAILVLVSRRQWAIAGLVGLVFAAGPARGVVLTPSQDSLSLLQQVASGTYVATGLALLALWAFGSGRWGRTPGSAQDGAAISAGATL
jgi:alpha-1,2-mannosyltransferase